MKTVLVVISQPNLIQLQSNESVAMAMLLSTFGHRVQVLLKDAAQSLLYNDLAFKASHHPFKPASNLVDSFEFYDLYPILIEQHAAEASKVWENTHEIEYIDFNADFLDQYDHVLYC